MGRNVLGELEHMLLVAILQCGDDAYGAAIIDEIERRTGQDVSRAGAYIALQRLEQKGLVTAADGEQTEARGGRPKRYFALTNAGRDKLAASAASLFAMWEGLSPDATRATSR